ncbi:hypothetical protein Angca_001252, partial [Angiostrongylus cantonensis]
VFQMDTDYDNIERVSLHPLLPSILFLNIFELFLLFAAILLNLLFLCVLLQYSVFHIHLRIICLHMTSAVTLLTVYSLIRPVANVYQVFGNQIITETDDSSSCFFVHVVPTCFCLLFIIFPLVLVIERAIATEKVRRYEDFHFPSGMMRLCLVFVPYDFERMSSKEYYLYQAISPTKIWIQAFNAFAFWNLEIFFLNNSIDWLYHVQYLFSC